MRAAIPIERVAGRQMWHLYCRRLRSRLTEFYALVRQAGEWEQVHKWDPAVTKLNPEFTAAQLRNEAIVHSTASSLPTLEEVPGVIPLDNVAARHWWNLFCERVGNRLKELKSPAVQLPDDAMESLTTSSLPTLEEIQAAIPPEGVATRQFCQLFHTRLGTQRAEFIALVEHAGELDAVARKILPKSA